MIDKIEITNELIGAVAKEEFKKLFNKELKELPLWGRNNWVAGIVDDLNDFNYMVEILNIVLRNNDENIITFQK